MGMAGSVLGKFLRIAFKYRWGPMKIPGRCRRKDLIPGLVNELTVCELENGPVEIVDLPSYKMVDLSIAMLVIARGYPKGGLEHVLKQPKLGTSVDRP